MRYDPDQPVDAQEWLAIDEGARQAAVIEYHTAAPIQVPNIQLHAIFHVIIENQIAEGDAYPVRAVLERLMAEGLDRHEAIHAIGSVLARHFQATMVGGSHSAQEGQYFDSLKKLTRKSWYEEFDD